MNKYRAQLIKPLDFDPNFQFSNSKAVVSVSMGNPSYNSKKFEAMLELINDNFKECVFVVCDTLARFNVGIKDDNSWNEEAAYHESLQMGDNWIERNLEKMKKILSKTKFSVKRWDEYRENSKVPYYEKKVSELLENNLEYKKLFEKTIIGFLSRKNLDDTSSKYKKAYEQCGRFIFEECAIMSMWCEIEDFDFDIYPEVRYKIISMSMQNICPAESYVVPLGIKLTKHNHKNGANNYLSTENILEQLLEHLPVHIYWKDKNGSFRGCSRRQAEFFGVDMPDIKSKNDTDFFPAEVAESIQENDVMVAKKAKDFLFQEEVERNNKHFFFLSHKIPLLNRDNEFAGILGLSVDITEQIEQKKQLEEALKAKSFFLDSVSHEIKTPLHVLTTILGNLFDEWDNLDVIAKKHYLITAIENNKRLLKLVTDMLDISRLKNNKMRFNCDSNGIFEIVTEVVKEFDYLHSSRKINVFNNLPENLYITCDKSRIAQVIRNLLDNAFKYGNQEKDINLYLSSDEHNFQFKIDSYSNLFDEEFDIVFNVFSQGKIGRSSAKGTGLGLAIAKEIIERHEGKIWVERKEENKDLVAFAFEIPIKRQQNE